MTLLKKGRVDGARARLFKLKNLKGFSIQSCRVKVAGVIKGF